jgi:hypothetical protein
VGQDGRCVRSYIPRRWESALTEAGYGTELRIQGAPRRSRTEQVGELPGLPRLIRGKRGGRGEDSSPCRLGTKSASWSDRSPVKTITGDLLVRSRGARLVLPLLESARSEERRARTRARTRAKERRHKPGEAEAHQQAHFTHHALRSGLRVFGVGPLRSVSLVPRPPSPVPRLALVPWYPGSPEIGR